MELAAESLVVPTEAALGKPESGSDRRADIDAKQMQMTALLQEIDCEGLLILDPENFAWLTSGASARGVQNAQELPALYFSADQHWVISSNVDSQRLFDEELSGLGFLLKEWPWYWGREQLLQEICAGRKIACDRTFGAAKLVGDQLAPMRRILSPYEQACYETLGPLVSHALEATCPWRRPVAR
jgi:hypothetical protein